MTIRELTDLVDHNGLHAAITIAAGKAEQRSRGCRMVEARRRLRIHVVTSGLGWVKPTRPAGEHATAGARGTAWPVSGTLSHTVTRPAHQGPEPPPPTGDTS